MSFAIPGERNITENKIFVLIELTLGKEERTPKININKKVRK